MRAPPDESNRETTTLPRSHAAPLAVTLRVLRGPSSGLQHRLDAGSCIVGAGHEANFVLGDDAVSRRHVQLELAPEGVRLLDLESRNGTFYREQRVQSMTLSPGSEFRVGSSVIGIEAHLDVAETAESADEGGYAELVGTSRRMRELFALLRRLEGSLVNVLIEGPSGTGKELVAQALHDHSSAASAPFLAINCAALDRQLVRSELFGHKKGAFTGATEHHQGAFEAANGGTLFLDEVAELPLDVQPMLLRALETSSVVRVGENVPRQVRVRVVAATNRNLWQHTEQGHFRSDLYFRLAVVKLRTPALDERREDIPLLAKHFTEQARLPPPSDELLDELKRRAWPGNVRELRNALHAYAALGSLDPALPSPPNDLSAALRNFTDAEQPYAVQKDALLAEFTRIYLAAVMKRTGGNQTEAARIAGLQRTYFGSLLAKFGVRDGA